MPSTLRAALRTGSSGQRLNHLAPGATMELLAQAKGSGLSESTCQGDPKIGLAQLAVLVPAPHMAYGGY